MLKEQKQQLLLISVNKDLSKIIIYDEHIRIKFKSGIGIVVEE